MWSQKGRIRLPEDGDKVTHDKLTRSPRLQRWLCVGLPVGFLVTFALLLLAGNYYDHHRKHDKLSDAEAETLLLSLPSNDSLRDWLKNYTSVAHIAGSENDYKQAIWMRDMWLEFGIPDVQLVEYYPMLNYPIQRRLAIVDGPEELLYEAKLREDVVDEDETSRNQDAVPTFHGYSISGNVTAEIVYVNYGRLADFEYLAAKGVEFTGKIALVRYGLVFRGLKVRAAELFGCVGTIIFTDPANDGPLNKSHIPESYPKGPWSSPSTVQRGSVNFMSIAPGDPLTPGYPATRDAPRLARNETTNLPSIPSLPISWEDALPLLRALEGHGIAAEDLEKGWKGGLEGVGYYSGPSVAKVNLVNEVEDKITPIWNVIGRINGTEEPDRVIVVGNHRDAWVFGATDPGSGSASLMELAKALGALLEKGWRPRRTILLASWDAEEYALVGSTEWVEDNVGWLREQCVAYLNVDNAVSGPDFTVSASPSLKRLLFDATIKVNDPATGTTVYEAWRKLNAKRDSKRPFVGQLGAGTDFVPFLDFVGVASISMSFKGSYGVYHSNYDSFHWVEKFGDPNFHYHVAMTQIWGILTLRLASQPILPMDPIEYATDLNSYVNSLADYPSALAAVAMDAPKFPILREAVEEFLREAHAITHKAHKLQHELDRRHKHHHHHHHYDHYWKLYRRVRALNDRLFGFERGFIDPCGLPGREWYKHVVYAPGLWAGYAAQTFPSIMEALDSGNTKEVAKQERCVARFVQKAARILDYGLCNELTDEESGDKEWEEVAQEE